MSTSTEDPHLRFSDAETARVLLHIVRALPIARSVTGVGAEDFQRRVLERCARAGIDPAAATTAAAMFLLDRDRRVLQRRRGHAAEAVGYWGA